MNKYARLGLDAQAGASNPIGLANALIDAVVEYPGGVWDATLDTGLRAAAHQLASLHGVEFPHRSAVYNILRDLVAATREFGVSSVQARGIAHHVARIFSVDDFIEGYGENMAKLARGAIGE